MRTLKRLRYHKRLGYNRDCNRGVEIHPYYFSKAILSIVYIVCLIVFQTIAFCNFNCKRKSLTACAVKQRSFTGQ
jgi:hypothetical protein